MKRNAKNILVGFGTGLLVLGCLSFISKISIKERIDSSSYINGLKMSILGDSISTFDGYSNDVNSNSTLKSNVPRYGLASSTLSSIDTTLKSVDETYWMKTINDLDMELCVSNTWRGTRVTTTGTTYPDSSSGCLDRSVNLHNDIKNIDPDIIVVYMGVNDLDHEVELGSFKELNEIYNNETKEYNVDTTLFAPSYAMMIHKITQRYKDSDLYLFNHLPNHYGKTEETLLYNEQIKYISDYFNCNYVDIYNDTGINWDNYTTYLHDGLHPNKKGMELISNVLKESLLDNYKLKEV